MIILDTHVVSEPLRPQRDARVVAFADGAIAAIARARRHAVATRNVADDGPAGVQVINPWTAGDNAR